MKSSSHTPFCLEIMSCKNGKSVTLPNISFKISWVDFSGHPAAWGEHLLRFGHRMCYQNPMYYSMHYSIHCSKPTQGFKNNSRKWFSKLCVKQIDATGTLYVVRLSMVVADRRGEADAPWSQNSEGSVLRKFTIFKQNFSRHKPKIDFATFPK